MNIFKNRIFVSIFKRQSSLFQYQQNCFSQYFHERDRAELRALEEEMDFPKQYKKIRDNWQVPLAKKVLKREQNIEKVRNESDDQKLVIHNPAIGIEYPVSQENIFAVLNIAGSQYKVAKDDIVVSEWLKDYDINDQIEFTQVMLVGTQHYTSIGRPFINTAKVYATVEEQCLSEKVIVFKKRRRQGYKKNQGSRQNLTVLRIDKIEHTLDNDTISKATSLI